jgi:hypothetical protein
MTSELTKLGPEHFDVANGYLVYGTVEDTAEQLQIPRHEVVKILQTSEVKRYLDGVWLDMGYRNRDKMGRLMDKIIEGKLADAEETGIYTSKDLLEVLALQHKMRMEELKLQQSLEESKNKVGTAVQINNQFGDSNYGKLMEKLTNGRR